MSADTKTEAQVVADLALASAEPELVKPGHDLLSVLVPSDGEHKVVDLEKYADTPRRKTGSYTAHDAESFVAYLLKHGDSGTEVWADTVATRVTAVLDAHGEDGPRWEQHKVIYAALLTDAWKAWAALDGKLLNQADFAEHIEARSIDVVDPVAADMLELAQTFQATIGVSFKSSKRLSSGERQLEYREEVDARAGQAGRMEIPEIFTLGLRPFEGAPPFKVTARLRYRIDGGNLRIGYRLERPEDVLRDAFLTVVDAITDGIADGLPDVPVLRGAAR